MSLKMSNQLVNIYIRGESTIFWWNVIYIRGTNKYITIKFVNILNICNLLSCLILNYLLTDYTFSSGVPVSMDMEMGDIKYGKNRKRFCNVEVSTDYFQQESISPWSWSGRYGLLTIVDTQQIWRITKFWKIIWQFLL